MFYEVTDELEVPEPNIVNLEIDESDAPKQSFHLRDTGNPENPKVVIGGVPEKWAQTLDTFQGDNDYSMLDCPGLVSISNIFRMAGKDLDEDYVVKYALDNHLCYISESMEESGSSVSSEIETILERHGIEADTYKSDEVDYEQMAGWVENGHGVIMHYSQPDSEGEVGEYVLTDGEGHPQANHHAALTGTVRDVNGNLLGYTCCDTKLHEGERFLSLDRMDEYFKDATFSDVVVTSKPIHDNGEPLYPDVEAASGAKQVSFGKSVLDEFLSKKSDIDESSKSVFSVFDFDEKSYLNEISEKNLDKLRNADFENLKEEFWDDKKYFSWMFFEEVSPPNCYCFACGFSENPLTGEELEYGLNPGEISGMTDEEMDRDYMDPIRDGDVEGAKAGLQKWISSDFEKVGKELVEVSPDYEPKDGETMIYMCGSPSKEDYHFMRKGDYGTWYHKQGITEPKDRDDYTGERIFNPEDTAKRCHYGMNLGYYVVKDKEAE